MASVPVQQLVVPEGVLAPPEATLRIEEPAVGERGIEGRGRGQDGEHREQYAGDEQMVAEEPVFPRSVPWQGHPHILR